MRKNRFVLMAEANAGDTGAAGGAGATDQAAAEAAAASATEGTGGAAEAAAAESASALAKGEAATGSDWLPEKYRTAKEDGSIDIEASAKKLAEAHSHLEKKLGSGDVPPATAADYTITPPEQFKDILTKDDPILSQFLTDAHAAGFTQKQVDMALSRYFDVIPQIANASKGPTPEQANTALREAWKDEKEFDSNLGDSYKASVAFGEKVGLKFEDLESAGLTNNAQFIKIMAAVGKEMQEDKPAGGDGGPAGGTDIASLQASEAYRDPKHADHAKVSEQVRQFYANKYGSESAL